jgi:hypothetical protein
MKPTRLGAWAVAGFALGALAAVWSFPRTRSTPAATLPAAGEVAAAPLPSACRDDAEVATRTARVEALNKEAESLFAANTLAHFQPPKDLPGRFGGKMIAEALHQAILAAGVEAEILGTDCREYPCVTTARARSAEDMQKIKHQFFEQPAYGADMKQVVRTRTEDPREYRFGVTVYQSTDPRGEELYAALGRRLGFARLGPGARQPGADPLPPETIGSERAVARR